MYEMDPMEQTEHTERYILVAVATGEEEAAWASLEELGELLRTAGAEPACLVVQNLPHPDRATYVGSGKARELQEMLATACPSSTRARRRTASCVTTNSVLPSSGIFRI